MWVRFRVRDRVIAIAIVTFTVAVTVVVAPGGHSAHKHTGGGQSENFTCNLKISAHFDNYPKISALLVSCTQKYHKL